VKAGCDSIIGSEPLRQFLGNYPLEPRPPKLARQMAAQ
jgi:hypothetical protein